MNRRDRRRQAAHAKMKPKPSGPPDAKAAMRKIVVDAAAGLPGYNVTIIVSENQPHEGRRPSYHLTTSASKRDVFEIMKSVIEKEYETVMAEEAAKAAAKEEAQA